MKTKLSPIFAVLLFFAAAAHAQFNYTTNNGTIAITGYTGTNDDLVIPSTIDGLPVTSIESNAFTMLLWQVVMGSPISTIVGHTNLSELTIPSSVTNVSDQAFAYCSGLTNITVDPANNLFSSIEGVLFSKNQDTIIAYPQGKAAVFYAIPQSVTTIGNSAFSWSFGLSRVVMGNGITIIGDSAFLRCDGLANVEIGTGVKSIGKFAFGGCGQLTSIVIPRGVTIIDDSAFSGCFLTNVIIPDSVLNIGDSAFFPVYGLTDVSIGNGVTNIGASAFQQCAELNSVTIGKNVRAIGDLAFAYTALASVTIPDNVETVGDSAFYICGFLTNVEVGAGVTGIGNAAFSRCDKLMAFDVAGQNSSYSSLNGVLFDKAQHTLLQYPGGKEGAYVIPGAVTSIGENAFATSSGLTKVWIPDSVTNIGPTAFWECRLTNIFLGNGLVTIGTSAFADCSALTDITLPSSLVAIGSGAFTDCRNLTTINFQGNAPNSGGDVELFVNDWGATVYYLPGTTGWGSTFGGIRTALWSLPYPIILNGSLGVQSNGFAFTVSWATNASVVLEGSTDLNNPNWSPVATNNLVGGSFYFTDPMWTSSPRRFFRVRSQ